MIFYNKLHAQKIAFFVGIIVSLTVFTSALPAYAATCQTGGKIFKASDIVWSKHHKTHLYCAGDDEWRYLAQWGLTHNNKIVYNDDILLGSGHIITNHPNGALVFNSGPFGTDALTGFWFRATDTLGVRAPYKDLVRITADGNVGIGINNPHFKLHIASDNSFNNAILMTTNNSGHGETDGAMLSLSSGNQFVIANRENGTIVLHTNNAERIRISANGMVGIGTNTPQSPLHVAGTIKAERLYLDAAIAQSSGPHIALMRPDRSNQAVINWMTDNNQKYTMGLAANSDSLDFRAFGTGPKAFNFHGGTVNVNNNRISGLAAPVDDNDAANKLYADMLGGRTHCNDGQLLKWDGSSWECANDNMGFGNSGGNTTYFDGISASFTSAGGCVGTTATNYTTGSNQGGHFNTSDGVFTVPENGYYHFNAAVKFSSGNGQGSGVKILKNNGDDLCFSFSPSSTGNFYSSCSGAAYLTAGTTVNAQAHSCGSAQPVMSMKFSGMRVDGVGTSGTSGGTPQNLEWHDLTLANGVGVYGSNYNPPQIAKDALGFVHYRGLMNGTPSGTVAFDIPSGFEPQGGKAVELVTACGDHTPCEIIFNHPNHLSKAYIETGNGTWVSLDGLSYYAGGGSGIAGSGASMVEGWPDAIKCTRPSGGGVEILYLTMAEYTNTKIYRSTHAGWGEQPYGVRFNANKTWRSNEGPINYTDCNKSIDELYADGQAFNFTGGGHVIDSNSSTPLVDMSNTLLSSGAFPQSAGSVVVPAGGYYDLGNMNVTPGIYLWSIYNCAGQHSYTGHEQGNEVMIVGSPVHFSSHTYMNFRLQPSSTCGTVYTGIAKMTSSGTVSARVASYQNSTLLTPGPTSTAFRIQMVKLVHADGTGSGGSNDNLGNHTATENMRLNGHWISGDGDNEGIFVDNNGRVGIGTNNPQYLLHVKSPMMIERNYGGPSLVFKNDKTYYTATNHQWEIYPAGLGTGYESDPRSRFQIGIRDETTSAPTGHMSIMSDTGNVGIGTANPSERLEVNGNIKASGQYSGRLNLYSKHHNVTTAVRCVACNTGDQIIGGHIYGLDNCTSTPCDADAVVELENNRMCAPEPDSVGYYMQIICLKR